VVRYLYLTFIRTHGSTFFYKLSAPDGVVGPHGDPWVWSGLRQKFEFKLKREFEFMQDLE
jgi:hypothetical protein